MLQILSFWLCFLGTTFEVFGKKRDIEVRSAVVPTLVLNLYHSYSYPFWRVYK